MKKTKQKLTFSFGGLFLLFAGVAMAGLAYLGSWNSLYIWLGSGIAVVGLLLIASLDVWIETIFLLFSGV